MIPVTALRVDKVVVNDGAHNCFGFGDGTHRESAVVASTVLQRGLVCGYLLARRVLDCDVAWLSRDIGTWEAGLGRDVPRVCRVRSPEGDGHVRNPYVVYMVSPAEHHLGSLHEALAAADTGACGRRGRRI